MKLVAGRVDTTVGELVAVLSEVAFDVCSEEKEACLLVSLAIEDLFWNEDLRRAVGTLISVSEKRLREERVAHA